MSNWPLSYGAEQHAPSADTSASDGILVTTGSADTKGTPSEMIAATDTDINGIWLTVSLETSTEKYLLDVMIGAAASEVVIVPDVLLGEGRSPIADRCFLPVKIAEGERISCRAQAEGPTKSLNVTIQPVSHGRFGSSGFGEVIAFGENAATSDGVSVDAGATANTKGTYVEFEASVAEDIAQIVICAGGDSGQLTTCNWLLDVAVGAAASEIDIISNVWFLGDGAKDTVTPFFAGPFTVNIKAGSRISARAQCSTNVAGDRVLHVVLLGFRL